MEKSNIEKAKELFIYAPLGAAGFVKDNAPTFFSMFVSRGKRDAGKTNFKPGENINLNEAQARGEEIAQNVVVGATKVIDFVENSVRSFADKIEPANKEVNSTDAAKSEESLDLTSLEVEQDAAIAFATSEQNGVLHNYETLSAPEVIDKLDDYNQEELRIILDHESNYRNRQTIIHAIGYRLNTQNQR